MTDSNPYAPPASKVSSAAPSRRAIESRRDPNFFARCWGGSARLWQAYWVLGILGQFVVLVVITSMSAMVASRPGSSAILAVPWLVYSLYVIFCWVCIWRCAHNTDNQVWGGLARVCVCFSALSVVVVLSRTAPAWG
jgi:hypothetical protein